MFIKSYKYYLKIYRDLPEFDKGLGFFFIPAVIFFLIVGVLLLPVICLKGNWLFGARFVNNNKVIEFIFGPTHHKISSQLKLVGTNKFYFNINDNNSNLKPVINDRKLFIISTVYGLETAFLLIKSIRNVRIKRNSVRLIKIVALAKFAKHQFKGHKVFVQYNDHIPYNLMLQELARKMDLKTVYIQHAPVSFRFPPLYHDLNVLFSNDSLTKYRFITDNKFDINKCLVLYDIRFPSKDNLNLSNPEYTLLCFNKLDDITEIDKAVTELINNNVKVRIRPHPEDYRKFNFSSETEISKGKTIWEDLASAHSVIVNESAVPLEALYCDVPVYKLSSLSLSIRDNYGFLKTGLLQKEYFSIEELLPDLLNKKNVCDQNKLDYFLGNIYNKNEIRIKLDSTIKSLLT